MRMWAALLSCALLASCGEGSELPDAGVARGVVLGVTSAAVSDTVGGVAPSPGYQFLVLDITIEARGVGPISIAPFAFRVTLEGGSRVTADSSTNLLSDGCSSRSVAVDESVSCRLLFLVMPGSPAPVSLSWSDASESATAAVPPLE